MIVVDPPLVLALATLVTQPLRVDLVDPTEAIGPAVRFNKRDRYPHGPRAASSARLSDMSESKPLPAALRFVVDSDDEWRMIEPYLETGKFPTGFSSWLGEGDDSAGRQAEILVEQLERRLAIELGKGRLVAEGVRVGAASMSSIDARGCEKVEILGEDGTGLRIHGLEYENVRIRQKARSPSLQAKLKLRSAMIPALAPQIAELAKRGEQTNYEDLDAFLQTRGIGGFTRSFLKSCAAEAGLTSEMVKRGRPKNNQQK